MSAQVHQQLIRILLMDDCPEDVALVEDRLAHGFRLEWAKSMLDAQCRIRDADYDVLVAALSLPDLDGLQVIGRIRAEDAHSPLVAIIPDEQESLALQAMEAGADECLLRREISDSLLRAIKYSLARKSAALTAVPPSVEDRRGAARGSQLAERLSPASAPLSAPPLAKEEAVLRPYSDRTFAAAIFTQHTPEVSMDSPQPRGPTRRVMFTGLVLACAAIMAYQSKDLILASSSGVVAGQRTMINAPFDGVVESTRVSYGQQVRRGELLAIVGSPGIRQQLAVLDQERVALVRRLEQEVAQLKWRAAQYREDLDPQQARYYDTWAALIAAKGKLAERIGLYERSRGLYWLGTNSQDETQNLARSVEQQQRRVASLEETVAQLEKGGREQPRGAPRATTAQTSLRELQRLRDREQKLRDELARGRLIAPTDGVVSQGQALIGDPVKAGQMILEISAEQTLEVVLRVDQETLRQVAARQNVFVEVLSTGQKIACRVHRVEDPVQQPLIPLLGFHSTRPLYPLRLQTLEAGRLAELYGEEVRLWRHRPWYLLGLGGDLAGKGVAP